MPSTVLHESPGHRNLLLEDHTRGQAVQANQHLIIHNGEGVILDPGGHKVYSRVLGNTFKELAGSKLKYIFMSHQDPDVVAATNGWLMSTDAEAWVSALWTRFVPHFGVDKLVIDRLRPIPDEGMKLSLGGLDLLFVPAHFLHSSGNHQVYDPHSKILYTGDLGASLGQDYIFVQDFAKHLDYMTGFHKRYMPNTAALHAWADMVRGLDIETIAPQHGAMFQGKELVNQFIDWCAGLDVGMKSFSYLFKLPE